MLRMIIVTLSLVAMLGLMVACSSSSDPIIADGDTPDGDTPDGDEPDGDTPDGDTPDGDTPDGDTPDGDTPDGDTPDGDTPACGEGEDGCCTTDADCLQGKCHANVCVIEPVEELGVYWEDSYYDQDEGSKVGDYEQVFDGSTPATPDFSCMEVIDEVDDAGVVDIRAKIKVFGVKAPCEQLIVEVYTQYDDSGAMRSEFPESAILSSASVQEVADENYECHIDLMDVPVGKWLVFKSYDTNNVQFKDTYQFNVYIRPEDAGEPNGDDAEPFFMEVNAISNTSWELVPLTAGVTGGVQSDRGAIAGTVKDCQGRLLNNATVGLSVTPTKLAYFNANVEDLLPDPTMTATNTDSTFASVNQPEGPVTIVAMGLIDGELTVLHKFTIMMIRQSVAIYGLHGAQPSNYGYYDGPAE